ncbi:hypothetical protein F4804DRAFT_330040 [Jackrogersella minutella]|nr:hypothetical protein F4804DRAFT_330040 [Jackrogersella minutella]
MSTQTPFPDLPSINITFPRSPITAAAFEYTQKHTSAATYNHCARAAYWAVILAKKLPNLAPFNLETVVLADVLHDMGWATSKELLSKDKRFEVDGANLALAFVNAATTVWDAVALHCTASIAAHHPSPEVALAHLGIMADFLGPRFPPGDGAVITEKEYRQVVAHFPLAGFGREAVKDIMCGLCREKPAATYDNFVSEFGVKYGVDGKGGGREEYRRALEEQNISMQLLRGLEYLEGLVKDGA